MDTIEIKTTKGALRGERTSDGIAVFRGIPYAAPPVGERRFAAPQPASPWDGTRDATRFGAAAMQGQRAAAGGVFTGAFGPAGLGVSEDCLTLNVWTPAADGARRPVLVWIHGGAFRIGTGGSPGYDGTTLASRGDVVVVSLNYRLGVLGFLYAPELGPANAGLLDQVAALQWVRDEIEAFGGDPDQVTIFGESAGGKSVECLLTMPAARGLFHRAIAQSTYAGPMDTESAAARTAALVRELGLTSVAELRAVDAGALLEADVAVLAANMAAAGAGAGGPVIDGDVLPAGPLTAIEAGTAATIPLLIGTTVDECKLFSALGAGTNDGMDEEPARIYRAALVERGERAEPADLAVAMATDRMFRQHSLRVAEAQADHQPDTYMYLFGWKSQGLDGELGACHGIELPFIFGTHDAPLGQLAGDTPEARALGQAVQDAWLAFARTGRPAAPDLPDWPAYERGRRATMYLDVDPHVEDAPLESIRSWWQGQTLASR